MKCSKCGEKCRSNQAFCIKCGSPIQVIPDFNLIEAELANNVGKLLNEDKNLNQDENGDFEDFDIIDDNNDDDDIVEKQASNINDESILKDIETKHSKKKKIILGSIIAAIVIIIAIVLIIVNINSNTNTFSNRYDKGIELYEEGSYDSALEELLTAENFAKTDAEKIKIKEALWDTYIKIGDKNEEIIKVLKELIKLDPKEVKYYEALVVFYLENGMDEEAAGFINSIDDTDIYETVSVYGIAAPTASIKSGDYDTYITVELSSNNAQYIYYTLDGSDPTQSSTLYEAPIELNTEGTTVLKAVAVSDTGLKSVIVEEEYVIKLSELPAPSITPDSGNYTDYTKITVTAQNDAKVYYTLDGNTPTKSSTLYSGAIDMPRGNNVFKAIAVNDEGVSSAVVTNIYNLQIARAYSVSQGINLLKEYFVQNGYMDDISGVNEDGSKYTFTNIDTKIINNSEYYIIKAEYFNSAKQSKGVNYYGVDTVIGNINKVSSDTNGKYFITD